MNVKPTDLASRLNSGQMQMIALMRACSRSPRILVLDEPTSALTNNEVEQMSVVWFRYMNGAAGLYMLDRDGYRAILN